MNQAERDRLEKLAQAIADLAERERDMLKDRTFLPSIPFAISEWFTSAVRDYLTGEKPTLDHALGLAGKRGAPRGSGDAFATALEIERKIDAGMTPTAIAKEMGREVSDIRQIRERYEDQIIKHWAQIASDRFKEG